MDTKTLTRCALMTAVISVLSPLSIPLNGLVPVSLATFAVMLGGAVLGAKEGANCAAIYLVLGAIGIPVFAGWTSGVGILFGMTGGFLFGYIPLAFLTGYAADRWNMERKYLIFGMTGGTIVLYAIGTIWFMAYMKMGLLASLSACVFPFLIGDALKITAVALIAPRVREAVRK